MISRRISFTFFASLYCSLWLDAQIKVADDSYKEKMSASNYISEPIKIDNCFEAYDGTFILNKENGFYFYKNIVGDTLYTNGLTPRCILVDHESKNIGGFAADKIDIVKGYYVVSGIYTKNQVIDELRSLLQNDYVLRKSWYNDPERHFQEYFGEDRSNEIKEKIEEIRLEKTKCDLKILGNYYVALKSNEHNSYYFIPVSSYSDSELKCFVPVRYYNFLCKELKDKDVFLTYDTNFYEVETYKRRMTDALTGVTIFQKDTLFHCCDIVVNDKNGVCCVLEGKNTGKFAVYVTGKHEAYGSDAFFDFCYRGNPSKPSIFFKTGQKRAGSLVWEKYYYVRSTPSDTYPIKFLLKVDDVNKMLVDSKKVASLSTVQRNQAAARIKASKFSGKSPKKQDLITLFGQTNGNLVANNKVALGMSFEMCRLAWGTPLKIYNSVDASGKYTIWVYNFDTLIYFKDDKVVRMQNVIE